MLEDCRTTVHLVRKTDHNLYQQGPCSSGRSQVHTTLQDLVEGKTKSTFPRVVDVRDVARAHILAAETPGASGRFLVSWETTISGKFALDVLREAFPHYDFPEGEDVPSKKEISCDKVNLPPNQRFSPCYPAQAKRLCISLQSIKQNGVQRGSGQLSTGSTVCEGVETELVRAQTYTQPLIMTAIMVWWQP